jgi:hypothetical protein
MIALEGADGFHRSQRQRIRARSPDRFVLGAVTDRNEKCQRGPAQVDK